MSKLITSLVLIDIQSESVHVHMTFYKQYFYCHILVEAL